MSEAPMLEAHWRRGARAIGIALRTAHLFAMALFVGGVFLGAAATAVHAWRGITIATGAALLVIEATHGRHWPYQIRGIATLAHVATLALLAAGGVDRFATAAALVLGGVGSHAPGSIRKFSLRHGRVMD